MVHQATKWKGDNSDPCEHGSSSDHAKGDNWNDLLKEVVTFDSVEEFWGVYVSLQLGFPYYLHLQHSLTSNLLDTE